MEVKLEASWRIYHLFYAICSLAVKTHILSFWVLTSCRVVGGHQLSEIILPSLEDGKCRWKASRLQGIVIQSTKYIFFCVCFLLSHYLTCSVIRFLFQASLCGICGPGYSPNTLVFVCHYHFTNALYLFISPVLCNISNW